MLAHAFFALHAQIFMVTPYYFHSVTWNDILIDMLDNSEVFLWESKLTTESNFCYLQNPQLTPDAARRLQEISFMVNSLDEKGSIGIPKAYVTIW